MDFTAVYTIWLRELKRYFRAKSRIIGTIGMPFFFLVIMGSGLNSSFNHPMFSGNYTDFMAPGIVGMVLLFASTMAGVSVLWDKQFGFLKEILVAPVSRTSIMVGKTVGGATTALFQALIMIAVSVLIGVPAPTAAQMLLLLVFMVLISSAFVALGVAFASMMEDPHGFQLVVNFVIMPVFFLSGALFPLDGLPPLLKMLSMLNPLTYGVDALRQIWLGIPGLGLTADLVVLSLFLALTVAVGSVLFNRVE